MSNTKSRISGICKGKVEMSEDFDELPPELLSIMTYDDLPSLQFNEWKLFYEYAKHSKKMNLARLQCEGRLSEYYITTYQWEQLAKLAKEMNLGKFNWEEFKSYRDEGKK